MRKTVFIKAAACVLACAMTVTGVITFKPIMANAAPYGATPANATPANATTKDDIKVDAISKITFNNQDTKKAVSIDFSDVKAYKAVFTADEISAINGGATAEVNISADAKSESDIPASIITKIKEQIKSDKKIALFYDINLSVEVAGSARSVTETSDKIWVKVEEPMNLPALEKGYEREYFVERSHDGEITEIECKVVDGNIVFPTDKFSVYAITYKDVKKDVNAGNGGNVLSICLFAGALVLFGGVIVTGKKKKVTE